MTNNCGGGLSVGGPAPLPPGADTVSVGGGGGDGWAASAGGGPPADEVL